MDNRAHAAVNLTWTEDSRHAERFVADDGTTLFALHIQDRFQVVIHVPRNQLSHWVQTLETMLREAEDLEASVIQEAAALAHAHQA